MAISFDPTKRRTNLAKHGIDLAECEVVFDRPMLTREDRRHYGEQRLVSLGWLRGRVVVLVWTEREAGVHVISCREAKRDDQETYFQVCAPL